MELLQEDSLVRAAAAEEDAASRMAPFANAHREPSMQRRHRRILRAARVEARWRQRFQPPEAEPRDTLMSEFPEAIFERILAAATPSSLRCLAETSVKYMRGCEAEFARREGEAKDRIAELGGEGEVYGPQVPAPVKKLSATGKAPPWGSRKRTYSEAWGCRYKGCGEEGIVAVIDPHVTSMEVSLLQMTISVFLCFHRLNLRPSLCFHVALSPKRLRGDEDTLVSCDFE